MPTETGSRGRGYAANACAILTLTVALGFAVKALIVEYQVLAMRDAAVRQAADIGNVRGFIESSGSAQALAPRSALLRATMRARLAGAEPALAHRLLPLASADLDHALNARPKWAEAQISATYIHYLADGPAAAKTRASLKRSYDAAPYLRDAAPWRIRYAISVWPLLDLQTQERVVHETAWLARTSGSSYNYARGLVAGSPAARQVDALLAVSNN